MAEATEAEKPQEGRALDDLHNSFKKLKLDENWLAKSSTQRETLPWQENHHKNALKNKRRLQSKTKQKSLQRLRSKSLSHCERVDTEPEQKHKTSLSESLAALATISLTSKSPADGPATDRLVYRTADGDNRRGTAAGGQPDDLTRPVDVARSSQPCPLHVTCARPCSCAAQARADLDTSVDELAGYLDVCVHIPRKMSSMAEMMYT